ncbi:hypothetical protein [Nocardioides sp. Soil805]|uniref:hypothetical protein n=1 Tax=Nocardioides sp. Soil805 TaxID=1736416 RepID=UPI0012E38ECD|nr:hypothetical protein [Nocardioides sp. Soil805]
MTPVELVDGGGADQVEVHPCNEHSVGIPDLALRYDIGTHGDMQQSQERLPRGL